MEYRGVAVWLWSCRPLQCAKDMAEGLENSGGGKGEISCSSFRLAIILPFPDTCGSLYELFNVLPLLVGICLII